MKTIREWLEELPEPYRRQALQNAREADTLYFTGYDILYEALAAAFVWDGSPHGNDYWRTVAQGEVLPYAGQMEPPTNALSALHAIALKEGFPVEEIMSVEPAKESGCWVYSLINGDMGKHFINLSNNK